MQNAGNVKYTARSEFQDPPRFRRDAAAIIYVLCGDCVPPVCDSEICASQMKI